MFTQINLPHKSYLFIDMITSVIFINIENYHKNISIKNYS